METEIEQRANVLIVDDEATVRETLSQILTALRYQTEAAATVREAEEKLAKGEFEVVLCDIKLPDASGLELLQHIKHRFSYTMVVMVTGVSDVDVAVEAMKQGASDYITKPVKIEHLKLALERALEKRQLLQERREYEERMEITVRAQTQEILRQRDTINRLFRDTVDALVSALEAKDPYTEGHSRRVTQYGLLLAKHAGASHEQLRDMELGGLLHDIGKIGVPDSVLTKPGKLTEEEFDQMKRHPAIGSEIVGRIHGMSPIVVQCIRSHHERWDGRGYPDGLKGEDIPLPGRIFAIADAFDAMTSSRSYRPALPVRRALEEVEKNKGTQFDPELADLWLELMDFGEQGGGNILVVDDDPIIGALFEETLLPRGHRVVVASSGFQAVRRIMEEPFDLIYLDLKLPTLDGLQALREIKRYRPDAFAVIITGFPDDERVKQMLAEGATICLPKPIMPDELVEITSQLLQQRFGNDQLSMTNYQ